MKPPESIISKTAYATGLTAVGAIGGAALSRLTKSTAADGTTVQKIPDLTGAIAGVLIASTAGAVTGEIEERGDSDEKGWGEVGRLSAIVGVGTLTVTMLWGLTKTYLAPPALPAVASGPVTLPVTAADSGKTLALKVGDTASISLPSTLVAGGTSPWAWAVPAAAPLQKAQPVVSTSGTEVDNFTATAAGTTTLMASLIDPTTGASSATFSLNIVAS
jgi:hypothetical protein